MYTPVIFDGTKYGCVRTSTHITERNAIDIRIDVNSHCPQSHCFQVNNQFGI